VVRCIEINLNIEMKRLKFKNCCNKLFSHNSNLTRHIKICKAKQEYKIKLEESVKLLSLSKPFPE
jgi:hypothetical protein